MRTKRVKLGAVAALLMFVVGALVVPPASAAQKYPSWDDIKNSQKSESAKKAEIANLTSLIEKLDDDYATAQDVADARNDDYQKAQDAYEVGLDKYVTLMQKAESAKQVAEESKKKAGAVAAQMYRASGSDIGIELLLAGNTESSDLLYKLSALGKLTGSNYTVYQAAEKDMLLVDSLSRDAEAAKNELADLEKTAQDAYAVAEQAMVAAGAALKEQQDNQSRLYDQLNTLEAQTATLIKDRQDGIKAERERKRKLAEEKRKREEAARLAAQKAREKAASGSNSSSDSVPPTSSGAWVTPVIGVVRSGYGSRGSMSTSAGWTPTFHNGVDIANSCGTNIYAAAAGTVVFQGRDPYGAEVVVINHGGSVNTLYAHMQHGHVFVSTGQSVKKGQFIADMGSTGLSTGCHLHFGIYLTTSWGWSSPTTNPTTFMRARGVTLGSY